MSLKDTMPLANLLGDDYIKNSPQQYMITAVSSLINQAASDFSINFTRPLDCSAGNWNVALVDLNVWNTLFNISTRYGNRTFRWAVPTNGAIDDTPVVFTGTLLPGTYNAPALIQAILDIMTTANYVGAGVTLPVVPDPNPDNLTAAEVLILPNIILSINQAQLTLNLQLGAVGFAFDPSAGSVAGVPNSRLYRNIGAQPNVFYRFPGTDPINSPYTNLNWSVSAPFPNQADISNGITSWQVRCSLVGSSSQNGQASDVLFNFVPAVAPGGAFSVQPAFPLKQQLNAKTITSVAFRITDQNGTVLNLQEGTDFANNGTTIALIVSRVG